jgi:hypothetical protein
MLSPEFRSQVASLHSAVDYRRRRIIVESPRHRESVSVEAYQHSNLYRVGPTSRLNVQVASTLCDVTRLDIER